jgi:hypothetical protein
MVKRLLKYRRTLRLYFVIKSFFSLMWSVFAVRSISSIFTDDAHRSCGKMLHNVSRLCVVAY